MQIGQIPVRTGRIPARKSLDATNGLPGCSGRESLDIHEKGFTTRSPRHGFGRRVRPSTWLCGVRVVFRSVVCLFVGVFLVRARDLVSWPFRALPIQITPKETNPNPVSCHRWRVDPYGSWKTLVLARSYLNRKHHKNTCIGQSGERRRILCRPVKFCEVRGSSVAAEGKRMVSVLKNF